jgi:hypothetical protein
MRTCRRRTRRRSAGSSAPLRTRDREPLHSDGVVRAVLLVEAARLPEARRRQRRRQPYANSLIQGRLDPYPKRRGFAQLKELLAEGVNVSLGNDVIVDPWYLLGKADLVDAASLALHFTYMSGLDEIPQLLDCATWRGARTLGVEDEYGIEEGKRADLVVFDAPSPLEVMRLKPVRRWVIRGVRVIAETTPPHTTLLGEDVTFAASH